MPWKDRVVLITGASSGIGKGLGLELATRGATVGLLARRGDVLDEIVSQITAHQGEAIALQADVRDAAAVRKASDRLRSEFGPIDVLIANAGIGGNTNAIQFDVNEIVKVFEINVIGAVNSVAAVIPEMVSDGHGQLVAISSLSAYRGLPKSAAYCASKAALSSFFESLRIDLAGKGVDVTVIHPGFIKTPLTAGRKAKLPFLLELDDAVKRIVWAIETRRKSYAFPWQLASVVRAGMLVPDSMYDWIARRNSFRE